MSKILASALVALVLIMGMASVTYAQNWTCDGSAGWALDPANNAHCIQTQTLDVGGNYTCPAGSTVDSGGMCFIPATPVASTPTQPVTQPAQPSVICADNLTNASVQPVNGGCPDGSHVYTPQTPNNTNAPSNSPITYTPLEPIPLLGGLETGTSNLGDLLNGILRVLVYASGFLAVGLIVLYGMEYMATDVVSVKGATRDHLYNAAWGLALLLGAYLILWTINPQLLSFSGVFSPTANLPGGSGTSGGAGSGGAQPLSQAQINTCVEQGGFIRNETCVLNGL